MGMFNQLVNRSKQMAGKYVRDQLAERQGQRPDAPRAPEPQGSHRGERQQATGPARGTQPPADAEAIARYRYMLRTAPPEDMERAHAEAFSRLTPRQRDALQSGLGEELPSGERPRSNLPGDLARSATRAEVAHPGFMERVLGGGGPTRSPNAGRGFGGLAAGAASGIGAGLLAGVAGGFMGSAIAGPLLEGFSGMGDGVAGAADGLGEGLGEVGGGLEEAASGLGDSVAAGGEALSGGGLLDGLLGGGADGFLGGGGDGFFGGGSNDWEL
ncbi:hypothetical protein [Arthrobacter sp.]|uniref:hypothetical protein n=1 Tax=Arthrobacter sp. TaxID=1667 RepID=UPI003A8EA415